MKRIISAALAAVVLFSSIHASGIEAQAGELQEERKDISECTFVDSLGERPYKVPYHDTYKQGTIRILPSQRYTGNAVEPKLTIQDGDYVLEEGKDYKLSYDDTRNDDRSSPVDAYCGSFLNEYGNEEGPIVDVRGMGNYSGKEFFCFAVLSENQKETEDHLIYSERSVLTGYDGIVIDGYVGTETEVEIPLYIDGKPVKEINENAFAYNPTLEKVNISDNVFRILGGAFFRCGNLKEINLSKQLRGIGSDAFAGCTSLKEITLPPSLEKLGLQVFSGSTALEAVHSESETIYDVDGVLFDRNGGINGRTNELYFFPPAKKTETYCIPDGTQWIGFRSFRQAEHVKNVIIPQSVLYVAQGAASAFGNKAEIVGESEDEISTNAFNIIFKHDQPTDDILNSKIPFSYTLPIGSTITVKNEAMKEAAEAAVSELCRENVTVQTATKASEGFELVKNAFILSKGEEWQLKWSQVPEDTTENITWESSDENVAKVDAVLGKITAKGYGRCKITGTDESGHKQDADIFVYDACKNHSLTLNGQTATGWVTDATECTIIMGDEAYIYLKAEADGYAGAQEVAFKSENEDVATVRVSQRNPKEAFLDVKKPGTATITATFDSDSFTITDRVTVHVVRSASDIPKPEDPIEPQKKKDQELQYKKSIQKAFGSKPFSLNVKLKKGNGKLSYTSSNKKAATVSSSGKVTIKGTGRTVITVTAKGTEEYREKTVKTTVDITPKKQKASVKALKGKKMTVKWKKDARATGYEVQYSTSKKFKGAKTVTVKKNKTASTKIKKSLKKGKTYYVRVRSYKSIKTGGKTKPLYGPWGSTVKSKKIK